MARSRTWTGWLEGLFKAKAETTSVASLMTPALAVYLLDSMWAMDEPDEVLRKAGKTRTELRKVAADDEVAAALDTRLSALLATPWRLEPGEGEIVDLCWNAIEPLINDIISFAWNALLYGYSVTEVVWRQDDRGRILPDRVIERPFEWFAVSREGAIRADRFGNVELDTENKFMVTRNRPTWRNPRGEALLARCYWPWFLRSAGWRMWARFLERCASPILLGKSANPQAMAEALAGAVQSAVAAVSIDDDVVSVPAGSEGAAYLAFCDAVAARIQKAILGQTLTTETHSTGSYATAKVHELVRQDRRMADIRMITPSVQWLVNAIVRWNFPGAEPPTFVMQDATGIEMERAQRDSILAATGQVIFTEQYLMRVYDFEPGDIEVLKPSVQPATSTPSPEQGPAVQAKVATLPSTIERIEVINEVSKPASASPINPDDIVQAIRLADSPEDLSRRLDELADRVPEQDFMLALERAMFSSEVLGYVHDDEYGYPKP